MWLRFFSVLCFFGAIVGGATFYSPITGLGVSEVYETAGAAIQTEVWLKVVITPLLGAIVFALLDIGWQLKEARQEDPDGFPFDSTTFRSAFAYLSWKST